nr:hypothetical protein KXZ65_20120 [Pectobacterium sp. PL152]
MGVTPPQVVDVCVGGARNAPASSEGDKDVSPIDIEVQMDIEIAGTLAPAAKIVVYFARIRMPGFWKRSTLRFMMRKCTVGDFD